MDKLLTIDVGVALFRQHSLDKVLWVVPFPAGSPSRARPRTRHPCCPCSVARGA